MASSGKRKSSIDNKVFDAAVVVFLVAFGFAALYPLWFVVVASVSDATRVNAGDVWLYPLEFHLEGYLEVFRNPWIWVGYRNSLVYTTLGTVLNVLITVMLAYPLSRRDLYGRKALNWYVAIPMWFGGGLIPTYLVVKAVGLLNTPLVLLVYGLVSSYNVIVCRAFISSLSDELQEAARIDGCSDFGILWKIVMPLSKPIIAVLALYYGVGHWNNYFNAMIYLNNKKYQTLQVFLREILLLNQQISLAESDAESIAGLSEQLKRAQSMKYALIIVASIPVMCFYPFVQKHFVKGVMVGSVKG